MPSNYERAGIHDVEAFYRDKFTEPSRGVDYYRSPLFPHHIEFSRFRWFDRHVRAGSRVLDFGCGTGGLGFLRDKGCTVVGIDLSARAAEIARSSGYESVFVGDLHDVPDSFLGSFDYVTSQDVLGHIEFAAKDEILAQLKRMLKPDGVCLHVIEAADIRYDEMSDAEIADFVGVDGHVGMEPRSANLVRFEQFFRHVDGEVRFLHGRPLCDMRKELSEYGSQCAPELAAYLQNLGPAESEAFDIATGIVFNSLEQFHVASDDRGGGLMLLRASDRPLPEPEFAAEPVGSTGVRRGEWVPIDAPYFLSGWHHPEGEGRGAFRWASQRALLAVPIAPEVRTVAVKVFVPESNAPCHLHWESGGDSGLLHFPDSGSATVKITRPAAAETKLWTASFEVDRVCVPAWNGTSTDTRRLGFCVRSVVVR